MKQKRDENILSKYENCNDFNIWIKYFHPKK